MPSSSEEWVTIANGFQERWQFPHVLGAMDKKHVVLQAPFNSGTEYYNYKHFLSIVMFLTVSAQSTGNIDIIPPSESGSYYYNYKGRHSMVLLAIVDAKYRFIMCDFGKNGRVSDGGVLQNTVFYKKLEKNLLKIPVEEKINNSLKVLPYVFVTDDAFTLRCDMMKPFRQAGLNSQDRKIFNYRLSRAKRIVENAFGILAARFRIFHTQINIEPNNIESVVMASCAMHKFLIAHSRNHYSPSECFDQENAENGTILPGLHAADHMIPLNRIWDMGILHSMQRIFGNSLWITLVMKAVFLGKIIS